MSKNFFQDVGTYLQTEEEQILQLWTSISEKDDQLKPITQISPSEFRNNVPKALKSLADCLSAAEPDSAADELYESRRAEMASVASHGQHRWKQGFNLNQLIRDWSNLNQAVLTVIEDYFKKNEACDADSRARIVKLASRFMTNAMSLSVLRYDDMRQAEAASIHSDLRESRQQLEKVVSIRSKLMHEFAHDMRNGMTGLAGASQLLDEGKTEAGPMTDEAVELIGDSIDGITNMLDEMIELTRLDAGKERLKLKSVEVVELLRGVSSQFEQSAKDKNLKLKFEAPANLEATTDPRKLQRITQNLLTNAIKYTEEGSVALSVEEGDGRWRLKVSDTGPGMQDTGGSPVAYEINSPSEAKSPKRESGPFKQEGEGIGLTIVKRLSEMLNAQIDMDSVLGKGTTFTLVFPKQVSGN